MERIPATGWVDQLAEALLATTLAMLLVTAGQAVGRKPPRPGGAARRRGAAHQSHRVPGRRCAAHGRPRGLGTGPRGGGWWSRGPLPWTDRPRVGRRPRRPPHLEDRGDDQGDEAGIPVRVVLYDLSRRPTCSRPSRRAPTPRTGCSDPCRGPADRHRRQARPRPPPPAVQQMTVPRAAGAVRLMASVAPTPR